MQPLCRAKRTSSTQRRLPARGACDSLMSGRCRQIECAPTCGYQPSSHAGNGWVVFGLAHKRASSMREQGEGLKYAHWGDVLPDGKNGPARVHPEQLIAQETISLKRK